MQCTGMLRAVVTSCSVDRRFRPPRYNWGGAPSCLLLQVWLSNSQQSGIVILKFSLGSAKGKWLTLVSGSNLQMFLAAPCCFKFLGVEPHWSLNTQRRCCDDGWHLLVYVVASTFTVIVMRLFSGGMVVRVIVVLFLCCGCFGWLQSQGW